jgi:predicted transposase/invertase (TIGR01784 family)
LPKWNIQKDVKEMNSFECWTSYFDKKTKTEEMEEIAMQEPMVKEAVRRESIFTQDEIRRRKYDLIEKAERDRIAQMDYAWEQGVERGIEQGVAVVAMNMLKENIPSDVIARVTSLPMDKILSLKQ